MNFQTLAADATAVLSVLTPVLDLADPAAAPVLAIVNRLASAAQAGEASAIALIDQVKSGTPLTEADIRAADSALDAAFADLAAAEAADPNK